MYKTKENCPILIGYYMNVASVAIILLLLFANFIHLILRYIYDTHQIYMLREIIMTGTAVSILITLNALPISSSNNDTNRATDALERFACVIVAGSFIMCAITSVSSHITNPLFPSVNLGWLFGVAGASMLILAFRPLQYTIKLPILGLGVLAVGFLLADGLGQGLITVGTIAWNVASDFEFSELIIILVFYYLIEHFLDINSDPIERNNRVFVLLVRQSLSVVAVFALVMGIKLQSATVICSALALIASFLYRFKPFLVKSQTSLPRPTREDLVHSGAALFAAACTLALVLRGLAHLGEAAAIGSLGLALAGILLWRITARDILALLRAASHSAMRLSLAFIAAALWNLLANWHLDLETGLKSLGVPLGAIFPIGLLALLGLTLRFKPLLSLVVTAPLLYVGLEGFVLAPVWSVPIVAVMTFLTLCIKNWFCWYRALGLVGSCLFVGLIVSAFGFEPRTNLVSATRIASSNPTNGNTRELALVDGQMLSVGEMDANTWFQAQTSGRAPLRPDHGGSAFDERRRQIFLFGADTHHRDWNNSITAFDLESQTWNSHYRSSPRYAMRADAAGNRISGILRELPWPMHTYDGVVYHPRIDSLVVAAAPLHSLKAVANGRFDPTWIYDLKSRQWKKGPVTGNKTPRFFGGTAIYDNLRNSVFYFNSVAAELGNLPIGRESRYFKFDLFQLKDDLSEWEKVSDSPPQWQGEAMRKNLVEQGKPGFNAEFDRRTSNMVLFMGNALGTRIIRYIHDDSHRTSGAWQSLRGPSDACGSGVPYAVAHSDDGQYLLRPARTRPEANLTCNYGIDRNTVVSLKTAVSLRGRMNFNLHYDPVLELFVLMQGNSLHGGRASVHYLKLSS